MSGNHITEKQVRLYMKFRKDFTQEVAASKAGISISSARRIENGRHQPNKSHRHWRTRPDPLEAVWDSIVVPALEQDDLITPVGVFDYLCESHSDKFPTSARRTLERRIKKWRQLHGSAKDVMFLQHRESGLLGICDFTHVKSPITIDPVRAVQRGSRCLLRRHSGRNDRRPDDDGPHDLDLDDDH